MPILVEKSTGEKTVPHAEHKWHKNPDGTVVMVHDSITIMGDQVTIEPGVQLGRDVMFSGETFIAEGAEVGNDVEVVGSTIMEGAYVGDHSKIINSTVDERSHIGQENEVVDAQVGPNVITSCGECITGTVEEESVLDIEDGV